MIKRWLKDVWGSVRRDRRVAAAQPEQREPAVAPASLPRPRARAIAEALRYASRRNAKRPAERLIQYCVRRGVDDPLVIAAIARHRLSEGRPEAALRIIETAPRRSAELRTLRAAVLIELGRATEAHADLHAWSRSGTMPDEARVLLFDLSWSTGGSRHALETANGASADRICRAIELLAMVESGADHSKCRAAAHAMQADEPGGAEAQMIAPILSCLELAVPAGAIAPQATDVDRLAWELALAPDVLSMLVAAQSIAPSVTVIRLLAEATERALPRLSDEAPALEALARLTMLSDDRGAARHWARRALEANPLSASMALLLADLDGGNDNTADSIPIDQQQEPTQTWRRAA